MGATREFGKECVTMPAQFFCQSFLRHVVALHGHVLYHAEERVFRARLQQLNLLLPRQRRKRGSESRLGVGIERLHSAAEAFRELRTGGEAAVDTSRNARVR